MATQFSPLSIKDARREDGIPLRSWLTDPETLVRVGNWQDAFELARRGCTERGWSPIPNLTVVIRDLFFSRTHAGRIDIDPLWETVQKLQSLPVKYDCGTAGQRSLQFGPVNELILYEGSPLTILSAARASGTNLSLIREGKFAYNPISWVLTVTGFLELLKTFVQTLGRKGRIDQTRLNLDVLGDGFLIRARGNYDHEFSQGLKRPINFNSSRADIRNRGQAGNYQKIWYGDVAALKLIMCRQQALVRDL